MEHRSRRPVAAWFLRALLVGAVALVAFLPAASTLGGSSTETARIVSYAADLDLSADGDLVSVETIVVEMPPGKRGIFRIFDTADPRRRGVEHPVDEVSVERDGNPEPAEWNSSAAGTETLRIGDPAVYLTPGQHTYVIRSRTVDAIEPDRRDDDQVLWWWDVVGAGWQMPMESVQVSASLPATPVGPPECVQGEDTPCTATVSDRRLTLTTGPLEPFTPVTVRVAFPADALPEPPGGAALGPTVWWSLLAAALAAAVGVLLLRATKERAPGFPVLFEPPADLYPALGAKVLDEVQSSDGLQATLFDLGERGILRLDGNGESWTVHLLAPPVAPAVRPVEAQVLAALGLSSAGDSFHLSPGSTSAGQRITTAVSRLHAGVDADVSGLLERSGAGTAARALGALSVLGVFALVAVYEFSDTAWVSWPLLAGTAALALVLVGAALDAGAGTRRTAAGREAWSRTGGFARFLITDSSESRFDAAAHLDWFPRYLPWAVALGSAEAWARRFEAQGVAVGTPGTVPYLYWYGAGSFSSSRMSDSFHSTIASASAAYAASQASSSSGGGGGFSGGSGGGGGGGGSW